MNNCDATRDFLLFAAAFRTDFAASVDARDFLQTIVSTFEHRS